MFKFIHAADIHLDSPLRKLEQYEGAPVDALRGATRRALENLVALSIDERVDFVLIAGDLYDGDWNDYNTGLFFLSRMNRLRDAGIRVFLITGNHDASARMTRSLRMPEGVNRFPDDAPGTARMEPIGVAIHGQGFSTPAVSKNLASKYPHAVPGWFNIGMLHTAATGREGHEPYAPCTMEDLLSRGYDYWALGHIHQREILHEEPWIVFSGNIQGRHIRETGPRGCMLVTVGDDGTVKPEFRPLDVIRWTHVNLDLDDPSHTAVDPWQVIDRVGGLLEQHLAETDGLPMVARIDVTGVSGVHEALCADPDRWINEIRSAAIAVGGGRAWIENVRFRTRTTNPNPPDDDAGGPMAEIHHMFDKLQSNPDTRKQVVGTLNDLMRKLPPELTRGPDAAFADNPAWIDEMLDEARAMLGRRLAGGEDES